MYGYLQPIKIDALIIIIALSGAVNVMDGSSRFSSLVWRALDRPVAQQAACTRVLLLTSESYKGESRCLYRYEL